MRKSKRMLAFALVGALGITAAACGDDDDESSSTTAAGTEATGAESTDTTATSGGEAPAGDLKLGIAFDTGGRGDGTFNDSAGEGADRAVEELGATVDELEAATADDRGPNVQTLTGNGNNPVIAVGFAFSSVLGEIAAANPDTAYAVVDGFVEDAPPNITHLGFAEQEGSFLVGAAAALACECDRIGFIGGQEGDLIKRFEAGYTAGATHINPDITVEVQYLGAAGDDTAWASPDEAKEIANGWYADGVEVIYSAAGGSGQGTIEAAVENDKWAIGVDSDQYLLAESEEQQQHILTSMIKRVDVAVFEAAQAFQDGTLEGGFITYDLAVDGVGYSKSGEFLADHYEELDALKEQIIAGEIEVPSA